MDKDVKAPAARTKASRDERSVAGRTRKKPLPMLSEAEVSSIVEAAPKAASTKAAVPISSAPVVSPKPALAESKLPPLPATADQPLPRGEAKQTGPKELTTEPQSPELKGDVPSPAASAVLSAADRGAVAGAVPHSPVFLLINAGMLSLLIAVIVSLSAPYWADYIAVSPTTREVGRLGRDVQRLERRNDMLRAQSLSMAASQLRAAAQRMGAYDAELSVLTTVAGGDAEITRLLSDLAPTAKAGIPTAAKLIADFDGYADLALVAESTPSDASWTDVVMGRLTAISYKVGRQIYPDFLTSDVGPVLETAYGQLDTGNLSAAVATVDKLPDSAKEIMTPWIDRAKERVKANAALDRLTQLAAARVQNARQ
jgi:hypothetical protein